VSGGSFNYLCFIDAEEIGQRLGQLDDMASALEGVCPEAAAATREIADQVRGVQPKIDALKDLWHAVEWWHSSDWGRGQVETVVAKYRAALAAAESGLSPALQEALAAAQNRCTTWHHVEIGKRWTGERLYDLLPCVLDKHDGDVPHRDPAGNSW
jgi:hypothetical protein